MFTIQKQCGLIEAVNDAVACNTLRCLRYTREGREQIRNMDNITGRPARFNYVAKNRIRKKVMLPLTIPPKE